MRHHSARPADGADALFGLDALGSGAPPHEDGTPGHDDSCERGAQDRPLFRDSPAARRLLPVRIVYAEPAAAASARGREILARFPDAEVVEVPSHWGIPGLHGNEGNVDRWVRVKGETLVLGERKTLTTRPNGRSADWIAPGASNGCAMACAYCYVPRRKGYANPVTVFTNIDAIIAHLARHIARQGRKPEPNQCDESAWVYDIGENGDCSVDALISDNTADLVRFFRQSRSAKASFATKFVNPDLLALDPRGRTRIRFSLMPPEDSRLLDIRTSPVDDRIAAAADFLDAGYEVHFNLSPVVLRPGWQEAWTEVLRQLDDVLPDRVKRQAACEVIMLTHNRELHEVNLGWHPRAEEVLWQPALQQGKRSENGALNVRYTNRVKAEAVQALRTLVAAHTPWLRIRYAF
ncbi:spore photoproduct lyase family protein [Streptomyces cinerochromogenes]|uniref:spore photoproduct lyase family protein n=1 Tax=Streptomyces cinerochromogenes TaxID=66422 RepID=UPI00166F97C2|nr:spore photoproduct lyase family protein [Streptomyces cinerochromogenes]GGS93982.1 spore photoproduct lyase family protein [Streptomyces cinerochromogenes]